jgi:hypothetical protein
VACARSLRRVGQIKSLAAGKMGMGTREVGDLIAKMVS